MKQNALSGKRVEEIVKCTNNNNNDNNNNYNNNDNDDDDDDDDDNDENKPETTFSPLNLLVMFTKNHKFKFLNDIA